MVCCVVKVRAGICRWVLRARRFRGGVAVEAGGRNCPGSGRLTTHGRDSDTRIGYLHDGVFVGNGPLSRKRASPGIPPPGGAGLLIVRSRIVPRAALAGSFSHRPFWGARCRVSPVSYTHLRAHETVLELVW